MRNTFLSHSENRLFVRWQYLALILALTIGVLAVAGCATTGAPNSDQALKLSTQIATVVAIKQFKGREAEAAAKIDQIASDISTFFDSSDLPFDAFKNLLNAKIVALNLSPTDALIAQAFEDALFASFESQINEHQVLTPEIRFNLSKVAGWVRDVAKLYESVPVTAPPGAKNNALPQSTAVG